MKIRWTGIRKYVLITGLVLLAVGFALQPYDMLVQNLHARYQPVFFKSRDGITDISGFLYFPQSYEPSAQYPTDSWFSRLIYVLTDLARDIAR